AVSGAGGVNAAGASTNSSSSVRVVLVGDREDVVENGDSVVELFAGDRERRADHDHVPVRHQVETAVERRFRDPRDRSARLAAGVERDERLARRTRLHELESPEAAEPAHLANRWMRRGEAFERL